MIRSRFMRPALAALSVGVAVIVSGCGQTTSGKARPAVAAPDACDAVVMFVLDVSLSMEATDVDPSRLTVAKQAMKEYAYQLAPDTNLGLVTFAGTASLMVTPTTDRAPFTNALDSVRLAERTATGEGIFTALTAIDTFSGIVPSAGSRRIILLSDGKQTMPEDLNAARGAYTAAREANVEHIPVSTISLGTADGVVEIPEHSGSVKVPVPTDPDSLREIARLSAGTSHTATTLPQLTTTLGGLSCRR
ncbi:VWA domain-containing protein [Nocardia sp. NPDC058666]|uniref:VWA domain-containing protein n=1 Tax=Nocardia sp. NPDC058666 TaxID=3346587 RepID=UPI003658DDC9